MENAGYLFAAFTIVWAFIFVYILLLVYKQRALNRDIESLKKIRHKEKGADS